MSLPWKKRVWFLYALFISMTIAVLVFPTLMFLSLGVVASNSHRLVIEKLKAEGVQPTSEECSGAVFSQARFVILSLGGLLFAWIVASGWLLSRATNNTDGGEPEDAADSCAAAGL